MNVTRGVSVATFVSMVLTVTVVFGDRRTIIVAHRGASGYLPEHTLAAKALAYAMGADFIEQDVVLTKDDHPIVLHDIHLDTTTDVAERFPSRARNDGRFYAVDFTLAEVQRLRVTERIDLETDSANYPDRFPIWKSRFHVHTLAEEIELIQGLNKSTGREVGIYTEVKSPAWHRKQDKDISRIVLDELHAHGYDDKTDAAYLQCFDARELRRIREELKSNLRLIQLIGENSWNEARVDFDELRTPTGLDEIAKYADGIGPRIPHVVRGRAADGSAIVTPLVAEARRRRLCVHPYTLRADALPEYVSSSEELLEMLVVDAKVDGVFTDFPDRAVAFCRRLGQERP